ncbi:MAG: hypothetical protein B0W54_21475 [Cellvibrio sp. 79]|nr:MAG: hypothetical protein B0W54_21475 [Cellvibrio sp. 79]
MRIESGINFDNIKEFFNLKNRLYRSCDFYTGFDITEIESFYNGLLFYSNENYCELFFLLDSKNTWIAAVILFKHRSSQTGYIGYFECIDDEQASAEILSKADSELKKRGCNDHLMYFSPRMSDPKGANTNVHLLPTFGMPLSKEYYPALLERSGYVFCKNLLQFDLLINSTVVARLETASRFAQAKTKKTIGFRSIDLSMPKQEVGHITEIYNSAWTENWGAIRYRSDELEAEFTPMMKYMKPEYCFFALDENNPIGFIVIMPDYNIHKYLLRKIKKGLVWYIPKLIKTIRSPQEYRGLFIGVKSEYRNQGIETCLINAVIPTIENKTLKIGWVLEENLRWANQIRYIGSSTSLKESSFQVYSKEAHHEQY